MSHHHHHHHKHHQDPEYLTVEEERQLHKFDSQLRVNENHVLQQDIRRTEWQRTKDHEHEIQVAANEERRLLQAQAKRDHAHAEEERETAKLKYRLEQQAKEKELQRQREALELELEYERKRLELESQAAIAHRRAIGDPVQLELDRKEAERARAALAAKEAAERKETERLKAQKAAADKARVEAQQRVLELKAAERQRLETQIKGLQADLAAREKAKDQEAEAARKDVQNIMAVEIANVTKLEKESTAAKERYTLLKDTLWAFRRSITTRAQDKRDHWTPDASVTGCEQCHSQFSLFNRRHHCRYCGNCLCGKCLTVRDWLTDTFDKKKSERNARICSKCVTVIEAEALKLGDGSLVTHADVRILFGGSVSVFCTSYALCEKAQAAEKRHKAAAAAKDEKAKKNSDRMVKIEYDFLVYQQDMQNKIKDLQRQLASV